VLLLVALLPPAPLNAREIELTPLDEIAPDMYLAPGQMLSGLRGKWVLLHFWATWCEPCVDELPALERLHRRSTDTLIIVTVALDGNDTAAVDEFRARHGITLPVVYEKDARGHRPYTGWGLPASYLIAPDGRVRARALGVRDWDAVEAGTLLRQLVPG
jgi:thiol-disulfide isomerase/thioredoxin